MRALVVREWTTFDKLRIEDDWPEPDVLPGTVLVRTQAVGVNFATSLRVQGKYQVKPLLPHVPGNELCGIVEQVGEGVAGFEPGDRVVSFVESGAFAERCVAPAHRTFNLPASIPFADAVGFTTSYMTAYIALLWAPWVELRRDQSILVHGAAGGVGLAALQIARIVGARVIATCGTAEKVAFCLSHGADVALNHRDGPFRDRVLEITAGEGVNVVFDPVGGDVFTESLRCLAPEGCIVPIGFASGVVPQIPANLLLVKNIRVLGFNNGYYNGQWGKDAARHKDMGKFFEPRVRSAMQQLFWWTESERLRPVTSHVFGFDEFAGAMNVVLNRESLGRVAVVMDGEAKRSTRRNPTIPSAGSAR